MTGPADVDAYIRRLDPELGALARQLRALVFEAVPEAEESIKWAHPTYESGGPFCYIKAFPRHVNLGFWRGATLHDAAGVVHTTGEKMGHVRIAARADIVPGVLTDLIDQAAALNARLGNPARTR
jgi:hypothetical protein